MKFAWSFEREAKWMMWMLLLPAGLLFIFGLAIPFVRRMLSQG